MILGFQDRFVPRVESGDKIHTIRAGQRWSRGMRADLYARVRRKDMRLLFRAPVVKVKSLTLQAQAEDPGALAWLNSASMDVGQLEEIAKADGFPGGLRELLEWLVATHGPSMFTGQLIYWDFERRVME